MSIEERLEGIEKRMQKLENALAEMGSVTSKTSDSTSVETLVMSKIDKLPTQDLVLIALKLKPKQKKSEIKSMLEDWGAKVGSWFDGGNLNTRMVNNNIVKKEELDNGQGIVFSLTKKGDFDAQKLINNLASNNFSN